MQARLERVLMAIARRYAPQIVPMGWTQPGDYPRPLAALANELARYNLLVMLGDAPATDPARHVKTWVDSYVRLYDLLSSSLFPSFKQVDAFYADGEQPSIVVIRGAATPVIVALANYVAPYIAARQGQSVSEVELHGLLDMMLEELEAGDLPRPEYKRLRDEGAALLRELLASSVRQRRLTEPPRPIFGDTDPLYQPTVVVAPPLPPTPPETPPEAPPAHATQPGDTTNLWGVPTPPSVLPEQERPPAPPPIGSLPEVEPDSPFGSPIPIFFNPKAHSDKRRPPVPDLPGGDGSSDI